MPKKAAALITLIALSVIDQGDDKVYPGDEFQVDEKEAKRLTEGRFPAAKLKNRPKAPKKPSPRSDAAKMKADALLVEGWKKKSADEKNEVWATLTPADQEVIKKAGLGPKEG